MLWMTITYLYQKNFVFKLSKHAVYCCIMINIKLCTNCLRRISTIETSCFSEATASLYVKECEVISNSFPAFEGETAKLSFKAQLRGVADKSLARPTSRCRRTESIVSLERGVCSCAELQVFSCYRGWKEACHATRVISTTSRCELSSSFFFFLQGKAPN